MTINRKKKRPIEDIPIPLGLEGPTQESLEETRRVTIRDVARVAGLCPATVSLSLRNAAKIPEMTRKKVIKIAAKLGYRPDPMIARLMSHLHAQGKETKGVLALLTCYRNPHTRNETYLSRCIGGATQRADRLGYVLEEFSMTEQPRDGKRMERILRARGIEGILVAPFREGIQFLPFDFNDFAAATMSFILPKGQTLHGTIAYEFANMQVILSKLNQNGYRRIGFALQKELEERSCHRWTGAFLAGQLHGVARGSIPPLIYPDFNENHLLPWLERYRPDVVISTEPYVVRWLQKFGYNIPKDIAFVSTSYAENLFDAPVSGIDERPEFIGSACVDLLVAHLHRNEIGYPAIAKEVHIPGIWTGDTTAPLRKKVSSSSFRPAVGSISM